MTWDLATFNQDGETQFVSRENVASMDRAALIDYIGQLESVISQLKYNVDELERLVGIK